MWLLSCFSLRFSALLSSLSWANVNICARSGQSFIGNPNRRLVTLCVATALRRYLEVTRPARTGDNQQLLLTFKKPFHPATSQTVSRWIKTVLKNSGVNTGIFKSHSTRHASTSAAARSGLNIDSIRETAGWTKKSEVFTKFYNRPLANPSHFAETILSSGASSN
ncbi:hypothetical protein NQ315_012229, partial [Exocentrus adspersus]